MNVEVKRMTKEQVGNFYELHCEKNGEGWCNCVAWWVPTWEGWGERTAEENRKLRDSLFERGEHDGYLLYAEGKAVGWAQCGRRDRLEKLCKQFSLSTEPDVWAVTCFTVAPEFRKKGLGHQFLAGIVSDLKAQGVKRVQAFPKRGRGLDDGEAWTGPEALYLKAGFRIIKGGDKTGIFELAL